METFFRGLLVGIGCVIMGYGLYGVGERLLTSKPPPASLWTPDPSLPAQAHTAMAPLMVTAARQYHWTEKDWSEIKRMALSGDTITVRAQAIYQVADQAGCSKCLNEKQKEEWWPVLWQSLSDPNEHIRTAALKTLYACRYENVRDMSKDPSDLVKYMWAITYGRKP